MVKWSHEKTNNRREPPLPAVRARGKPDQRGVQSVGHAALSLQNMQLQIYAGRQDAGVSGGDEAASDENVLLRREWARGGEADGHRQKYGVRLD